MRKPLSLLGFMLLAAAPAFSQPVAPGAGPDLRMCSEVRHAALAGLGQAFPRRLSLASFTTTVRDAPNTESKVLGRLPRGTALEAHGWVQGSEVRNNCDASPYDGCIDLSDAWVEVTLPGKGAHRGFLSAINVSAPTALSCPTIPFTKLMNLQAFDTENEPAPDPGRTLFDAVGLEHFLAVPVWRGQVTLNHRQLELFVRLQPQGRLQYSPSARQNQYPELQSLMADVEFQPALPAFAVQGDGLVRVDIGRLELLEPLLTWGEEEHMGPGGVTQIGGEELHLREVGFRVPSMAEDVEVLILTTPKGAKALARGKAKVSRKKVVRGKKTRQQDVVTREMVLVDLDGNGSSELVREYRTIDLFVPGEGDEDRTFVRVGYGGAWYELAWARWARYGL
jgi:hypothetical protein